MPASIDLHSSLHFAAVDVGSLDACAWFVLEYNGAPDNGQLRQAYDQNKQLFLLKQARYEEIKGQLLPFLKQCGFRESSLQWLPAVGTANENLVKQPTAPELNSWWKGRTLLQTIDSFR